MNKNNNIESLLENQEEIWKPIPGYEDCYEASTLGRIRSIDRIVRSRPGCKQRISGKIRITFPNETGYHRVMLSKDGKNKSFFVHRLICVTFNGPRPGGSQVNHKSGIKADNRAENLEWCTCSENIIHSRETGLRKKSLGEDVNGAKLKNKDVIKIRDLYKNSNLSQYEISKMFGIRQSGISNIINRKTWKHI